MSSSADLCSCWTSLDSLPLADIKALFTADGFELNHRIA